VTIPTQVGIQSHANSLPRLRALRRECDRPFSGKPAEVPRIDKRGLICRREPFALCIVGNACSETG
jgi:hypothetical protein